MSAQTVKQYLQQFGIANRIIELTESSATVPLAAHALHTQPAKIAKSLSFDVDGEPVLVVMAGDARIANPKFKLQFNTKARLLAREDVESMIGQPVGGVCPFALNPAVKVYLDQSLKRFETVFPAAGSSNNAIELSLPELERFSQAKSWVDVTKID